LQPFGLSNPAPLAIDVLETPNLIRASYSPERVGNRSISREIASDKTGAVIFYSVLVLIPLTAVPYGAAEPWWKAVFECLVLALAGFSVVHRFFVKEAIRPDWRLLLPLIVLISFAFLQTIPWPGSGTGDKVSRR